MKTPKFLFVFILILFIPSFSQVVNIALPSRLSGNPLVTRVGEQARDAAQLAIDAAQTRGNLGGLLATHSIQLTAIDEIDPGIDIVSEVLGNTSYKVLLLVSDNTNIEQIYGNLSAYGRTNLPWVFPVSNQGLQQYRGPNPNTFTRNMIFILPSIRDEFANIVNFVSRRLLLSRYVHISPYPELMDLFNETLGTTGNKPQAEIHTQLDNPSILDEQIAAILEANPQVIVFTSQAFITAVQIITLKNILPPSTVYIMVSLAGFNLDEDLVTFGLSSSLTTAELSSNIYISHSAPPANQILADTTPNTLGARFVEDALLMNSTLVPTDTLVLELYRAALWLIGILESVRGNFTEENILDTIYRFSITNPTGDQHIGPYLDDCSQGGIFTCCNSGERQLQMHQLDSNGVEMAVDNYVFEWDTCQALSGDVKAPFVFGQSTHLTEELSGKRGGNTTNSSTTTVGRKIQTGIIAAFNDLNEKDQFNGRQLQLLTFEDNGNNDTIVSNADDLTNGFNVLALIGFDVGSVVNDQILPSVAKEFNVPIIGTVDAYPPLWQEFSDLIINLSPSIVDEIAAALLYFQEENVQSVALVIDPTSEEGIAASEAAKEARKSFSIHKPDVTDTIEYIGTPNQFDDKVATSDVDFLIFVTTSTDNSINFAMQTAGTTGANILIVGEKAPLVVFESLSTQEQQTDVMFTKGYPPPVVNSTSIVVQNYLKNLEIVESDVLPSYPGLEGFVTGQFVGKVLAAINGEVTREKFQSTLFSAGLFRFDDLTIGPLDNDCPQNIEECCNQGTSSVHFIAWDTNLQHLTQVFQYKFESCGVDFTQNKNGDGETDTLAIAGGVVGGVIGILVICCACILGCMLFAVLLLLFFVSIGYLRLHKELKLATGLEESLEEPNYTVLVFPYTHGYNKSQADAELLGVLPYHASKSIEHRVDTFENLLLDTKYLFILVKALRSAADDVVNMCAKLVNVWYYNEQAEHMLEFFAEKEIEYLQSVGKWEHLFREDTLLSRLYRRYIFFVGLPYLWHTLALPLYNLRKISSRTTKGETDGSTTMSYSYSMGSIELDPRRKADISKDTQLTNMYQLKLTAQQMCAHLKMHPFPATLRFFLHKLIQLGEHFATNQEDWVRATFASTVFLRYICPALTAPHQFGLMKNPPNAKLLRVCILLSKVLQNLASGRHFKEEYMFAMIDFIDTNLIDVEKWMQSLPAEHDELVKGENESEMLTVPMEVYQCSIKQIMALALRDRENVVATFQAGMSKKEFKECSADYLKPIGFFEMRTVEAPELKKRRRRQNKKKLKSGGYDKADPQEETEDSPLSSPSSSEDIIFEEDYSEFSSEEPIPKKKKKKKKKKRKKEEEIKRKSGK